MSKIIGQVIRLKILEQHLIQSCAANVLEHSNLCSSAVKSCQYIIIRCLNSQTLMSEIYCLLDSRNLYFSTSSCVTKCFVCIVQVISQLTQQKHRFSVFALLSTTSLTFPGKCLHRAGSEFRVAGSSNCGFFKINIKPQLLG